MKILKGIGGILLPFVIFVIIIGLTFQKPSVEPVNQLIAEASFGYQLQNINKNEISNSKYSLLIIDTEGENGRWTKEDISFMKRKGKTLFAYVSIGEAEDYRWYWKKEWSKNKPDWLGNENPEWKGNYSVVDWWNSEWVTVVHNYIDYLIDVGFDGIYLDKVDVYDDLGGATQFKKDMIDFVIHISQYAKMKKPDFSIIPQNATELVYDHGYINAIDGIGREDLIFSWKSDGWSGNKNSEEYISNGIKQLLTAKNAGKFILVTEYVSPRLLSKYKNDLQKYGFMVYSGPRDLGKLRE